MKKTDKPVTQWLKKHFKSAWHFKHEVELHPVRYIMIGAGSLLVLALLISMANMNTMRETLFTQASEHEGDNIIWLEEKDATSWDVKAKGEVNTKYIAFYVRLARESDQKAMDNVNNEYNYSNFLSPGERNRGVDLASLSDPQRDGRYNGVARGLFQNEIDDNEIRQSLFANLDQPVTLFTITATDDTIPEPRVMEAFLYEADLDPNTDSASYKSIRSMTEVPLRVISSDSGTTDPQPEPPTTAPTEDPGTGGGGGDDPGTGGGNQGSAVCPQPPESVQTIDGMRWQTVCDVEHTCSVNQDCINQFSDRQPVENGHWCYGFEEGNQCMILKDGDIANPPAQRPDPPQDPGAGDDNNGGSGNQGRGPVGDDYGYFAKCEDLVGTGGIPRDDSDRNFIVRSCGLTCQPCEGDECKDSQPCAEQYGREYMGRVNSTDWWCYGFEDPGFVCLSQNPYNPEPLPEYPNCPSNAPIAYWDDNEDHCVCTNNVDTWQVLDGVNEPGVCAGSSYDGAPQDNGGDDNGGGDSNGGGSADNSFCPGIDAGVTNNCGDLEWRGCYCDGNQGQYYNSCGQEGSEEFLPTNVGC